MSLTLIIVNFIFLYASIVFVIKDRNFQNAVIFGFYLISNVCVVLYFVDPFVNFFIFDDSTEPDIYIDGSDVVFVNLVCSIGGASLFALRSLRQINKRNQRI